MANYTNDTGITTIEHARLALAVILLVALSSTVLAPATRRAAAGPVEPHAAPPLVGAPDALSRYWHDQRWVEGDYYACALYAQASVLEALGYSFADELRAARELGLQQGWYIPYEGTKGLGQPLRAHGIAYTVHGSPLAPPIEPDRALSRLQLALQSGRLVLVNLDAQALAYYRGSAIMWHTLWVTGMRLTAQGTPTHIITNDSYRGAAVEYPVDEFLAAWGSEAFNYYGIFVIPPEAA